MIYGNFSYFLNKISKRPRYIIRVPCILWNIMSISEGMCAENSVCATFQKLGTILSAV